MSSFRPAFLHCITTLQEYKMFNKFSLYSLLLPCRLSFSSPLYPYILCTLIYSFYACYSLSLSMPTSTLTEPDSLPSLIVACSPPRVPADDRAETDAECSMMVRQTYAHLVFSLSPLFADRSLHLSSPFCFPASI